MFRNVSLMLLLTGALAAVPGEVRAEDVATLFPKLSGRWQGRVPGVYEVSVDATAYKNAQPWKLWSATIKIQEGSETIDLAIDLSRNDSVALSVQPTHFLRVRDVATGTVEHYTLSPDPSGTIATFWRPTEEMEGTTLFASAQAIKLGIEGGKLVFAFISGQGYCTESGKTSHCASDGYRPFFLARR